MEVDQDHTSTNMSILLEQSNEVLHLILACAEPADLGNLSRSCRSMNEFITGNELLWKELYLQRWDQPEAGKDEIAWAQMVKDLVTFEKTMRCKDAEKKRASIEKTAATILPLLANRNQILNTEYLTEMFQDQSNIDSILAGSSLFKTAGTANQQPAATPEGRQLAAKLHCYYGVPIDTISNPMRAMCDASFMSNVRSPYHIMRPSGSSASEHGHSLRSQTAKIPTNHVARARVYDLRQYNEFNGWGPFFSDRSRRVDWERVESVAIVLNYNMHLFAERAKNFEPVWKTPWDGASPYSFVSPPSMKAKVDSPLDDPVEPTDQERLNSSDPYGIAGSWMRVVTFLDYSDLYHFNFGQPIADDEPRPPIDTREAIRLIKLNLHVTKISPPNREDGDGDGPVVQFRGTSRSLSNSWDVNANSGIRGVVRMTPEGEVHWTTFSIFHGEERWRSEGIQVGGIGSKRGVLGTWCDKDFDEEGPVGPTAFWKISSEEEEESEDEQVRMLPNAWWMESDDEEEDGEHGDEEEEDDDDVDDDEEAAHEHSEEVFVIIEEDEEVIVDEDGQVFMGESEPQS